MRPVMNRAVFTMKQPSVGEMSRDPWHCPSTHQPIARLRIAAVWGHRLEPRRRRPAESKTTTLACVAAIVAALLVAVGVLLGTIYLSGLLIQRLQELRRYGQPQAQYSDVWKWQQHR